jgi:hypothetical protein
LQANAIASPAMRDALCSAKSFNSSTFAGFIFGFEG